jgi:hypothetical protein
MHAAAFSVQGRVRVGSDNEGEQGRRGCCMSRDTWWRACSIQWLPLCSRCLFTHFTYARVRTSLVNCYHHAVNLLPLVHPPPRCSTSLSVSTFCSIWALQRPPVPLLDSS